MDIQTIIRMMEDWGHKALKEYCEMDKPLYLTNEDIIYLEQFVNAIKEFISIGEDFSNCTERFINAAKTLAKAGIYLSEKMGSNFNISSPPVQFIERKDVYTNKASKLYWN